MLKMENVNKDIAGHADMDSGSGKDPFTDDETVDGTDVMKIIGQIQKENEQILRSIGALENLEDNAVQAVVSMAECRERTNQQIIAFLTQDTKEKYFTRLKEKETTLGHLLSALRDVLDNDSPDMDSGAKIEIIAVIVAQMGKGLSVIRG